MSTETTTADNNATISASTDDEEVLPKDEMEFQAETRQLLDIVTHSLYTDKEVFLRELVSNASDALEKLRHLQVAGKLPSSTDDTPLEIRIETDEASNTLTITDTGVGMTRSEMVSNLGTIARSGSKAFVEEMKMKEVAKDHTDFDPYGQGIIGKFGVGFYSGFMVADKVDVRSKSAKVDEDNNEDEGPILWESTGTGKYSLSPLSSNVRQDRGTSVVLHLKPDLIQYADETTVEKILKKYSNFVGFPIYLNGNRVNTIEAIWLQDPKSIEEKTHSDFYKYVSSSYDEPLSTLHFRMDAPLDIKALLYIPSFHQEKYGMGRMDPGVSMYSRKVLVESKSPHILPEWCRFIKGVVDSEDLPLSISREKPQDSALVGKMRKALTRKIISHLSTMMRKETDTYKEEFYKEYSYFLKEGVCQDFDSQQALSKLLYFETSKGMTGELVSLDEYVSRCPPETKDIYYLFAPTRELALQSPYMEAFAKSKREVIFIYTAIDDFVMANLKTFEGRELLSADRSEVNLPKSDNDSDTNEDGSEDKKKDDGTTTSGKSLSTTEATKFCAWFQTTLPSKVSKCKTTNRLSSSPAVIVDNESGALRRMMRIVETQDGGSSTSGMPLPKQTVEINPDHEIIVGMNRLKDTDPVLAQVLAEQIYDNCLVAAGLLDDGRSMLPRLNDLMLCVVKSSVDASIESQEEVTDDEQEKVQGDEQKKEEVDLKDDATIDNKEK
jgi:HSP90 family molecular chaperone